MASYHRVLETIGRPLTGKNVECDCDIHSWNVLVNGARWPGKIRLIGFVDVFFLISYSGESRFETGIVVYKNDDRIRSLFETTCQTDTELDLKAINANDMTVTQEITAKRYYDFQDDEKGLYYNITSLGHEVGVKTKYENKAVKKYTIKIRKGENAVMRRRIERAVSQHDLFDLMHDSVRMGFITMAELIKKLSEMAFSASSVEDIGSQFMGVFVGNASGQTLSADVSRGKW